MRANHFISGLRGAALIAVVYIYFLIFAQFAFLTRLAELGIFGDSLKIAMTAMAAAGILFSLLIPRTRLVHNPARTLRIGLAVSAFAALVTLLPLGVTTAAIAAFLIGAGLGITTVTLVTHLRDWTGERRAILHVGLGTGIAYFICNVPSVFTATAQTQAILGSTLCLIAVCLPLNPSPKLDAPTKRAQQLSFRVALASFAALIWLDSAAFYIIQHTAALKAGTWLGSAHLWTNGSFHFITAVLASLLLQRGRSAAVLALAFSALAFSCVLLQHSSLILSASLFYPVGVSLYSVALVAYPSFLTSAESTSDRARQAGWIYAIAGWMGSALGIGMGQNLGQVPLAFVTIAGIVVLAPICIPVFSRRIRELVLIGGVGAVAFVLYKASPGEPTSELSAAERGRQVYISEGCISCHSQYVRPGSTDVTMWGPAESMQDLHAQKPPLIGNRRQGPDLSQVGLRRSPLWLKAHLINPTEISFHSPMPSYAFLFKDARGNDLVLYLSSLHSAGAQQQLQNEVRWSPAFADVANSSAREGYIIYRLHCAACHDSQGAARIHWLSTWRTLPQTLPELRAYANGQDLSRLAQIAKFGIPGTDMPGHEYLSDQQLASVALWLKLTPMRATSEALTSPLGDHK